MGLSLAVYLSAAANVECFLLFTAMLTMPLVGARVWLTSSRLTPLDTGGENHRQWSVSGMWQVSCVQRGELVANQRRGRGAGDQ